jgi:dipeptidyl aminopeptidase/acylaminoacyl peptidase
MIRQTRRLRVVSTAALLVFAATAAAQERFTPLHVAKIRTVAAVAISPDGQHAAYVLNVPRVPFQEEDGPAWDELHVVGRDGKSRPFVTGQVNVASVKWTPDGRGLLYLAKRSGDDTRAVHMIPLAGGETRRVLTHATDVVAFDISKDGRRIAFVARPAPVKERQELAKKGFNQEIYEESSQPQQLFIADLKDGVASGSPREVELPGHPSNVSWSPDGSRLIVIHAPTPLVDDDLMRRRVWIVDASSRTVTVKIENPGKLGPVAWSPDGQSIALVSAADINDPSEGRLMVVPAAGGALKDLLPGYEAHVRQIAWKDGDTVVYAADEGVWTAIGEVRRDGSSRRTLVPTGGPIVTTLDIAENDTIAVAADTPQHPGEVFFLPAGASRLARATESNPWLASMRMAKQELVA